MLNVSFEFCQGSSARFVSSLSRFNMSGGSSGEQQFKIPSKNQHAAARNVATRGFCSAASRAVTHLTEDQAMIRQMARTYENICDIF